VEEENRGGKRNGKSRFTRKTATKMKALAIKVNEGVGYWHRRPHIEGMMTNPSGVSG